MQVYYEKDARVVYMLHHVITRYCSEIPDTAYIYARMLARFAQSVKLWEDEEPS